ncbi:hypothetical protein BD311DRAFT_264311 [Dichomitus squalens]|uniref:Uncharacterized protein n=1 Tax=Dichomitus squalens TaxID=114155 RepID=A0A4V2K0M4_9APHY|nr:hypothetical protein BD311DRAFT_264311 [Dichomitus squalens]
MHTFLFLVYSFTSLISYLSLRVSRPVRSFPSQLALIVSLYVLRYHSASRCSFAYVHCFYLTACRRHPPCISRISSSSWTRSLDRCISCLELQRPPITLLALSSASLFAGSPPPPHDRMPPSPLSPRPPRFILHDQRLPPHILNVSMFRPCPVPPSPAVLPSRGRSPSRTIRGASIAGRRRGSWDVPLSSP